MPAVSSSGFFWGGERFDILTQVFFQQDNLGGPLQKGIYMYDHPFQKFSMKLFLIFFFCWVVEVYWNGVKDGGVEREYATDCENGCETHLLYL